MERLRSNIWKYALLLASNKRIFAAILGAYYLTIPGVTPQFIGIILSVGTIAGFVFEIPSGYIADKIGHKQALILSHFSFLASTLFFLFAHNLFFLILGGVFLSIAGAFHSGTGNAFVHETLRALGREHDYARVIGKTGAIGYAVPIALTAATPFLVSVSFRLPFLAALVVDFVGLVIAASLVSPPVRQEEVEEIRLTNFRQVMREGYRFHFFAFALFSGVVSGMILGIGGFRAPYQTFLAIPVIWYGVFHGIGRAGASLLSAYSGKIKAAFSRLSFYRFQLVLYTILIVSLGLIKTPWVVVPLFIILNAFQWGLNRVDSSYLLDVIKTSKFKATLLSTRSQIDKGVATVSAFVAGFLIERLSYQYGFLFMGLLFFAAVCPLYLYLKSRYGDR